MSKSLQEVLTDFGVVVLPSSSGRFVASCPYHEGDKTPSFTIYSNNTYFCFSCRAWGDSVKFLIEKQHFAPDAAYEYVGEDTSPPRKTVIKVKDKSRLWPFLYEVTQAYHSNLMETPGAISYLQSRGLSIETIKKFQIGYTDGGVLDLKTSWDVQLATEYGIVNNNGYEILSHRITIPNFAEEKSVDYIVGRTVTHDKIKYLGIRTPKPIFGIADAWASPILFLAEGQLDWLVLREWGFPSVVLGGTHVTSANASILRERKVVIIPDNDAPGIKAAVALKSLLGRQAIILDYADMGVKDVGELGPKEGARTEFIELVKEKVPWQLGILRMDLERSYPALRELVSSDLTTRLPDYLHSIPEFSSAK